MANISRDIRRLVGDPKRVTATAFTGAVGAIVLLDALLDIAGLTDQLPAIGRVALALVNWSATLIALALLIGILSVATSHMRRVLRQNEDWPYSLILLIGMVSVIMIGIIGIPTISFAGGFPISFEWQSLAEEPIRDYFEAFYQPLASSMLALLAFFSLSAILRSVRQRNREAWVILGVALLVLITQFAPIANLPYVGATLRWFNDYIVLAGARGLLIGVALGTMVASMRVLLGFDQPYLDR